MNPTLRSIWTWINDCILTLEYYVLPRLMTTRRRRRYRQVDPSMAHLTQLKTLGFALGGTLVVLLSVGMVISQSSQHWLSDTGTLNERVTSNSSSAQASSNALGTINSVDGLQQKSWENGLALMEALSRVDSLMANKRMESTAMRDPKTQSDSKTYQASLNQQIAVIENLMAERKALLSLAKRHHVNTLYTPMVQSQLNQTLNRLAHSGATLPPQWRQWQTLLSDADESPSSPTL